MTKNFSKWPREINFLRHGKSGYNAMAAMLRADPRYKEFKQLFDQEVGFIHSPLWVPSAKLVSLAQSLLHLIKDELFLYSDQNTPLADIGWSQAVTTGELLKHEIEIPDVVIVSPYVRTIDTYNGLVHAWPELGEVQMIKEERIRERGYGIRTMYGDRRIFMALKPEEAAYYAKAGKMYYCPPRGESHYDVKNRLRQYIGTMIREYQGKKVLLVSHHLTIMNFMALLFRWEDDEFLAKEESEPPRNCSWTQFKTDQSGKLKMTEYNKIFYAE